MEDNFRHKGLRKKLAEEVKKKGITDERIIHAINTIPRHLFMDSSFVNFAYKDKAFPIGSGQTISQPYTVAFQTELLQIKKNDKILEIGTGSGYQAAVLIKLGANVFTIERQKDLFLKSQALLTKLGYHPRFFFGDGFKGVPTFSPYDKILITAGANQIPDELLKQLKIGGRMVIPFGNQDNQEMMLIEKKGENEYVQTKHGWFSFVPMLKGTE